MADVKRTSSSFYEVEGDFGPVLERDHQREVLTVGKSLLGDEHHGLLAYFERAESLAIVASEGRGAHVDLVEDQGGGDAVSDVQRERPLIDVPFDEPVTGPMRLGPLEIVEALGCGSRCRRQAHDSQYPCDLTRHGGRDPSTAPTRRRGTFFRGTLADAPYPKELHVVLRPMRSAPRVLYVGAVLGLACGALGGCTDLEPAIIQSSIRTTDPGLDPDIERWLEGLSPEERAVIEKEIRRRKRLLIHVSMADLPEELSRGAASDLASSGFSQKRCEKHPKVEGVPSSQDWDTFIDRKLAEKWAKESGIDNPPYALLHHEIRGHILLMLRNPGYLEFLREKDKKNQEERDRLKEHIENMCREIENEYRRQNNLEEVPKYLPRPKQP